MTGVFSESALSHASANVRTTQLSNTVTREFPGRLFTIIAGSQTDSLSRLVVGIVAVSMRRIPYCFGGQLLAGNTILALDPLSEIDKLASLRAKRAEWIVFPFDWITTGGTLGHVPDANGAQRVIQAKQAV